MCAIRAGLGGTAIGGQVMPMDPIPFGPKAAAAWDTAWIEP